METEDSLEKKAMKDPQDPLAPASLSKEILASQEIKVYKDLRDLLVSLD